MQFIREWLGYILLITGIVLLRIFVVSPVMVDGASMEPTLYNGDYMLLNKIDYFFGEIQRFDIVVIQMEDKRIVKRIIGLPGDNVVYRDNRLYINDEFVEEPYSRKKMENYSLNNKLNIETIPENHYLVFGDNRLVSFDSRDFGLVEKKNILGKASFVLLPLKHFGGKE